MNSDSLDLDNKRVFTKCFDLITIHKVIHTNSINTHSLIPLNFALNRFAYHILFCLTLAVQFASYRECVS